MNETYNREYSWILDRDMEYAVFGDSGKVMFAFAPQNGHTLFEGTPLTASSPLAIKSSL